MGHPVGHFTNCHGHGTIVPDQEFIKNRGQSAIYTSRRTLQSSPTYGTACRWIDLRYSWTGPAKVTLGTADCPYRGCLKYVLAVRPGMPCNV